MTVISGLLLIFMSPKPNAEFSLLVSGTAASSFSNSGASLRVFSHFSFL